MGAYVWTVRSNKNLFAPWVWSSQALLWRDSRINGQDSALQAETPMWYISELCSPGAYVWVVVCNKLSLAPDDNIVLIAASRG